MAVVLLASVWNAPRLWADLRREPVFWLAVALTVYVLIRSLLALKAFPELDDMRNPHWTHMLRVTGLLALVMGWWLYKKPNHLYLILLVAILGLFVGILYQGQLEHLPALDFSRRRMWGYHPNYLGLVSGAAILALLAWLLAPVSGRILRVAWVPGGLVLITLTVMLITSQSRAAWLALPIGVLALLVALLIDARLRRCPLRVPLLLGGGSLVLGVVLAAWLFGDVVAERIADEADTVALIAQGDIDGAIANRRSVGVRAELWKFGIQAVAERPLFGWGVGAGQVVLDDPEVMARQRHFHNYYLEVFVGLGVVGALLHLLVAGAFMVGAWRAYCADMIPPAMAIGLFAVTVHVAVTLFFELRIGQTEGRAALTLLTGVYAAILFKWRAHNRLSESA